jgi:ATP/maltotriose-dependent transcriptional regulator MalT
MALRFGQKLIVPTATRPLLDRARLSAQIEAAVTTRRVVALTAPAGWGKTTALAQWAAGSSLPVGWYTLGHADRDPHLFLDYLLQAVAPFVPGAAALGAQLETTAPRRLPDIYHAAALEIAAAPSPFALVLDDFHLVDDEHADEVPGAPLIFELIGTILEYAEPCHVVLASRTLPARQGLARMGVQQRATVLDYRALQFDAAEVERLARLSPSPIVDTRAAQLVAQLDGWIAGIVLSLGHPGQPSDAVPLEHALDKTQIYDFFAEQMLAPLDRTLQEFLEDSSVLEDLSPQRCNMLRVRSDSAQFLNEARSRGFLAARRGDWLAYHSLFRDFLRARLAQDPSREQVLVRRAGDLYRADDDVERALECYLTVGAADTAIDLLQASAPRFIQLSRQTMLLSCFERLGAYLNRHQPRPFLPPSLLIAQGRVYRDLALWDRAELVLQLATTLGDCDTRAEATILHAELLELQGDHQRALAILESLDHITLPPSLQFAYHRTMGRVQVQAGAFALGINELEQAQTLALATAEVASNPATLGTLADLLGWAYAVTGDRAAALRHLQRADACWQASGNAGPRAMTLNNLGVLAMEENRYAEARDALENGLAIARQTARRRDEIYLCISRGELDIVEGDLAAAVAAFRTAYTLAMDANMPQRAEVALVSALWAAALAGDVAEVTVWQQIAAARKENDQPEVAGRRALAASTLLLRQPRPDWSRVGMLSEQVSAASLQAPERLALELLRAAMAFEREGWDAAAPYWNDFAHQCAKIPDALLGHFVALHRRLFEAAAGASPLARRLLATRQQSAPRRWRIQALGEFACVVDGVSCDLSPRHRALLVCLLEAGPKGLTVEQVWEAVWGDSELSMPALHQALYRLRSQTSLDLAAREGVCRLGGQWDAIEYDVRALERLLDAPANHDTVQRVIALYQGDFLTSASLSAAQWADARRSYLRQRYLDMLELFAHTIEDEAPEQAIEYYQRILQIDTCREQTAVQLMRLAGRSGNYSLLTNTFHQLVGALRALGLSPEPATMALLPARKKAPERLHSS